MNKIFVGAASNDITPKSSQFLYGYPHEERYSTGVHDPLESSAIYFGNDSEEFIFIGNDIIYISRKQTDEIRTKIYEKTGIPKEKILVSGTHTHSGPVMTEHLSHEMDSVVPPPDSVYCNFFIEQVAKTGIEAYEKRNSAAIGLAVASGEGIGTNRRDPSGPSDTDVPVLVARDDTNDVIAVMVIYCMHPTVLHEDSKLVSADFPGYTKKYIREQIIKKDIPVIYHTGPEGNQSTRHVVTGNTFQEAERIGTMLGKAIEKVIPNIHFNSSFILKTVKTEVQLLRKSFGSVQKAEEKLKNAINKLETLKKGNADRRVVRTAECDWFGAEESLTLAKAEKTGRLKEFQDRCMPAEIQAFQIGDWFFIGWPGEMFIEYDLELRNKYPNAFIINLANGELQGYIVTPEAAEEGGYEASNALFKPESGNLLVNETIKLIETLEKK